MPARRTPGFVACLLPLIRRNADELLRQRAEFGQRYSGEALHRLRVAIRRLQTATKILAGAGFPAPPAVKVTTLQSLRRSLGPSRDADVLLDRALPDFAASEGAARPRARLWRRLAAWRVNLHRAARQTVLHSLDDTLVATIERWLAALDALAALDCAPSRPTEAPAVCIDPRAASALERRFRRVRRQARRLGPRGRADLHACRIATKKLRYTLDALADRLPRADVARWTTALAALQDELGRANDALNGRAALRLIASREDRAFVKAHARWTRDCVRRHLRRARREWRHVKALPRFWREE